MKTNSLGFKHVSFIALSVLFVVSVVFFIGYQVMNGRFHKSPKAITMSVLEKFSKSEKKKEEIKKTENFQYDFFTLLEQSSPKRELVPIAMETNPAILAKQNRNNKTENITVEEIKLSRFSVQVSSFQKQEEANTLASQLQQKGYRVVVITEELPDKGKWYRVRIDGGKKRKNAEQMLAKIEKSTGLKGFVVEAM